MNKQPKYLVLACAILGLGLCGAVESAITVDTTSDVDDGADGLCSLREAITTVNNIAAYNECTFSAAPETINFSVSGTITLLSALPAVVNGVTISGPGSVNLAVSGNLSFPVFVFDVGVGAATITDLTIQNAGGGAGGAVINNSGNTLTMRDCVVTGADGPAGIQISSTSTLTMERCLVDTNAGHGLDFACGSFGTITDSTVINNSVIGSNGAGIYNCGELDIVNTTISDNTTDQWGGGIANDAGAILRLIGSTVSGNSDAQGAAGLFSAGNTLLINSTISGNIGNGIYPAGPPGAVHQIYSSTIAMNQGIGLDMSGGRPVQVNNTIIAKNPGANCTNPGVMNSFGYNIEDTNTCGFVNIGDLVNTDPRLELLQDNGGLTFTHALPAGSSAIDAGDPNGCTDPLGMNPLSVDQRGEIRPSDGDGTGGAVCDIGAYEAILAAIRSSSGCALGTDSRFDPVLPALFFLAIVYLGIRRRNQA